MSTNLRKKALLPIIAMVIVSVITLSSVTYAWFSMSDIASVDNLNVNVKAAEGIQISVDGNNWTSLILADDIRNAGNTTNQMPENDEFILPVSTDGTVTNGKMEMFLGKLNSDTTMTIEQQTDGGNNNYIVFDLFFKMSKPQTVTLVKGENASKVVSGSKNSANSARVAFLNFGASDNYDTAKNDTELVANGVTIWEPVAGSAPAVGLTKATEGTNAPTTNGFVTVDSGYAAVVNPATTNGDISFDLGEGINKVRIYIWMEGQDADCTNDASGGSFATYFQFKQPTANA